MRMAEARSCSWTTGSTAVNEGCQMTLEAHEVGSDLTHQLQLLYREQIAKTPRTAALVV